MDKNFKVLISEEEKEYAKLGTEVFEKHGFVPKYCEKNGRRVLEEIEEFEPDVVLMDVFMSGVDGIGVIKKVKAARKENTPVFTTLTNATVPVKPAGPKRVIFVLVMLFLATMGTIIHICRKELREWF